MKVYELLADESKWAKGGHAFTKDGERTDIHSDDAHSFCLTGAIEKCYGKKEGAILGPIYNRVTDIINYAYISMWNDKTERTHAEVIEVCRKLDI